ncbi:hypothetical protein GWN42_30280, partial [candidate division KSB1 bacterium]|nr:hypothetical protein [candidate division KSB1 bacterium]
VYRLRDQSEVAKIIDKPCKIILRVVKNTIASGVYIPYAGWRSEIIATSRAYNTINPKR